MKKCGDAEVNYWNFFITPKIRHAVTLELEP